MPSLRALARQPSQAISAVLRNKVAAATYKLATLAICAAHSPAIARTLSCPETIQTTQTFSGTAPPTWRAIQDKSTGAPVSHWSGIEFSDGPPENQASLAPDDSTTLAGNRVDIYKFPASIYKRIYLTCTYAQTSITLTQNPNLIGSVCQVTYTGLGDQAGPQKIACIP